MICAVSLQKSAHVCDRQVLMFMCASHGQRLCVSLAGALAVSVSLRRFSVIHRLPAGSTVDFLLRTWERPVWSDLNCRDSTGHHSGSTVIF